MTTDGSTYLIGEPVGLAAEVCNTGDEVAEVDINVGIGVVDAGGNHVWGMTIVPWVNMVSLAPGECVTAVEHSWDQLDYSYNQVAPGFYRGEAVDSLSAPFEILDQPVPAVPLSTAVPVAVAVALIAAGALLLAARRGR